MLVKQQHPLPERSEIPLIGFIAYDRGQVVGAAFLRQVEGMVGLLDGITSNPEVASDIRHKALDALIEAVVNKARELGIKRVIGYSVNDSTKIRSERHGFVRSPYELYVLNLNEIGDL